MGAEPHAGPPPRVSAWAVLSLLCGIAILCPVASLLAPILGAVALVRIRRRPHLRGTGLAVAGILLGLPACGVWGLSARWWDVNARQPMLWGPVEALAAGQAGDVGGFMAAFDPPSPPPSRAEAAAFLDEVTSRYGRVRGSQQRPEPRSDQGPAPAVDTKRPRVSYTFLFDNGSVDADARFVVWAEGRGLVLKFAWLDLRDPRLGDLVYPASAAARVGYDLDSRPEPSP